MTTVPRIPTLIALACLALAACGDNGEGDSDPRTIGDHVRVDDRFTFLEEALRSDDQLEALDADGPLTLFAATDAAFEALLVDQSISRDELFELAKLGDFLRYHVHNGAISVAELERVTAITTTAGIEIHVRFGLDGVRLNNGVRIVSEPIIADNGVIHVLDAVLERPLVTTTVTLQSAAEIPLEDRTEEGLGFTTDFFTIEDAGFLHSLQVNLDIRHTRVFDLIVFLENLQTGAFIPLVNRPFSFQPNIVTTMADSADFDVIDDLSFESPSGTSFPEAAYRPVTPLEFLVGEQITGEWRLTIIDRLEEESGTLSSWGLVATYGDELPGPAIAYGRGTSGSGVLPLGFKETINVDFRRVGGLTGDVEIAGTAAGIDAPTRSVDAAVNFGTLLFDIDPSTSLGSADVTVSARVGDISRVRLFDATVVAPDAEGIELVAHVSLPELGAEGFGGNDIWGWTDPLSGVEYALMGTESGTSFVDLSTPESPVVVGFLPTQTDPSSWRDIKVYQNHAFVVSEAEDHGLQVFDLTQLRGVTTPQTFAATAVNTDFGNAHNIAINEDTGFAYVVGATDDTPSLCFGGLLIIDISTPTNPTTLGCFGGGVPVGEVAGPNYPTDAYIHDVQCVAYAGPDPDHQGSEICISSDGQIANNENYVAITDVSVKAAPVQLARESYVGAGYAHQGWLTEDHQFFILNDEFDEFQDASSTRSYVWDVRDLDNPVVLGSIFNPRDAVGHNAYIKGNTAYMANYTSGLRLVDVSDVANVVGTEVGYFDSFPSDDADDDGPGPGGARCARPSNISNNARGVLPHPQDPFGGSTCGAASFNGAWSNYPFFDSGIIVISDMARGLFVVRPTP